MAYRLVIFDFDGTLADSAAWMRSVLNQVAQKYRFRQLADHEFEAMRGLDARTGLTYLGISSWKLPFIAHHVRGLAARDAHLIGLFAGVREVLAELAAKGIVVAVVSSNSEANIRRILGAESAGHVQLFACGAGLFGKRKKFREVLKKTKTSRTDTICIGDEVRDIEAATAEGMASGAVTWGYATAESLRARGPTVMIDSVEALRRQLLG